MTRPAVDKRELRASVRRLLAGLPDGPARSRDACARVLESAFFKAARAVLAYLPLPGELDPTAIIDACFESGRVVCAPAVDWEKGVLTPRRLRRGVSGALLVRPSGRHGVREPAAAGAADDVDPANLDLVLVPGLAFDGAGGRLGRGSGFYDRLLPRLSPACVACGVCFDVQLLDGVPMEEGDAPVDAVVTDRRLIVVDRPPTAPRRRGGRA